MDMKLPSAGDRNMTVWGTRIRGGLMMGMALAAAGWLFGTPQAASAHGFPAAQAEAQGDTGVDPYSFPKINLCCERRSGRHGGGDHGHGGWGAGSGDPGEPKPPVLVDCAVPTQPRISFGSVQEAMSYLRGAGTIYVAPGAPCEVSGLQLNGPVTIATDRYGYGARARLVSAEACISVNSGRSNSSVTFGGLDIDGCVSAGAGETVFDEVNLAWRNPGPAINVLSGSLVVRQSTVRAKDVALNTSSAGRIVIDQSTLATTVVGQNVARISAARVQMNDVQVKGGVVGILFDSVTEALELNKVNVYRTEPGDPYPPMEDGRQGIVIRGAQAMQDLPWLPGMDIRRVKIVAGSVTGYGVGILVGAGSSVLIEDMSVNGGSKGISVDAGAIVDLKDNRIRGVRDVGIDLQTGARGEAKENHLQCVHGRCVCYGGDCSSRSKYSFGNGAFRMTDTDCDD
jgi:hypothetical protein